MVSAARWLRMNVKAQLDALKRDELRDEQKAAQAQKRREREARIAAAKAEHDQKKQEQEAKRRERQEGASRRTED